MRTRELPDAILLVEQNDGLAELILSGLRGAGCPGRQARVRNEQEALDYAYRAVREPDVIGEYLRLVILDMDPPTPDNLEALERLRSDPSCEAISLLVLSPYIDPAIERRCRQLKCHGYVSKWQALLDFDQFSASIVRLMTADASQQSTRSTTVGTRPPPENACRISDLRVGLDGIE